MRLGLAICTIIFSLTFQAQVSISGTIKDSISNVALPFASISLKKTMSGTTSNEHGAFKVLVAENSVDDSLVFSFMGYRNYVIPVKDCPAFLEVQLTPYSIEIGEVVISPKTPQYYIKQFQINRDSNYVNTAFATTAFYREQITENDQPILHSEAIFKSVYPEYRGDKKNQHQIVLHRERDDIRELEFMKERREKYEKKQIKKAKKEGREISEEELEILQSFNGPERILALDFIQTPHLFLDSAHFKKYDYTLEPSTFFDNHEIIVISFEAKRNIDNTRSKGKIYLDKDSYAIASLEYYGYAIIPAYIKPILFAFGLGIKKPRYDIRLNYREVNNQWYPDQIYMNVNVNLTHKRLWKKNTHSNFDMETFYGVNQLSIENIVSIPKEKRFDSEKKMADQVFPDPKITWDGVNVVTRRN